MNQDKLLTIEKLTVSVTVNRAKKKLLDQVSFDVVPKSIVGLVGGSGSGKTTTGLAVLRLLPPELNIDQGKIVFQNKNLLELPEDSLRQVRGKEIGMVFQEPLIAFNPVYTIGYQIDEVLKTHTALNSAQRKQKILSSLESVGVPDPLRVAPSYPHQLSGGLRQRAMIAMALAGDPKLIIADEPTSNLDVTHQAMIMDLFLELKERLELSVLLITHDLGMVSHLADSIVVLRQGQIVESGPTKTLIGNPKEEYTRALMSSFVIETP